MRNKTNKHVKRPIRLFISAGILFFLLLLIVLLFTGRQWDGYGRFTIVLNSPDSLFIFSIEPGSKNAIILSIPSNTMLNVPYGYGEYIASSIYKLGLLDSVRGGGRLLSKSIETSFGIPVSAFISGTKSNIILKIDSYEDLAKIKKKFFSIGSLPKFLFYVFNPYSSYETNLSIIDKFSLWNRIRLLRTDRIKFIKTETTGVFLKDKLPDNTSVYRIDGEILGTLTKDNFTDAKVREEGISMEVVNATKKDRIASEVANILNNLGANVIIKTTSENVEQFSCIMNLNKKQYAASKIVKWLENHYSCKIGLTGGIRNVQTEIQLIIGEGFLK